MISVTDAPEIFIPAQPVSETDPSIPQPVGITIEAQLNLEIIDLWSEHVRLNDNKKFTTKELRIIRAHLAEKLYEMKSLLSHPGRNGEWRGWLRERKIPRSTADRLVSRHAEIMDRESGGNVLTGAISQPAEADIEKLAKNTWQRIGKLLTTNESVIQFIGRFAELAGVGHERRDEGLMILNPPAQAAEEEVPNSTPAIELVPESSDDRSTSPEEAIAEPVTLPPAEQAASTGETGIAAAL